MLLVFTVIYNTDALWYHQESQIVHRKTPPTYAPTSYFWRAISFNIIPVILSFSHFFSLSSEWQWEYVLVLGSSPACTCVCQCVLQLLFHTRLKPPVVNLLSLMSGPLQRLESPSPSNGGHCTGKLCYACKIPPAFSPIYPVEDFYIRYRLV